MPFPKTAILIPAYKRPEYTKACLNNIEHAQAYENVKFYLYDDGENLEVMQKFARKQDVVISHDKPIGLRNVIIDFFESVKKTDVQYLCKVDNDCLVHKNWLTDLIYILATTKVDILSPNVSETNAAFKYGKDDTYELGYRPSSVVGGLWNMRRKFVDNIFFENADTRGIRGAFALLHQIIVLNQPRPLLGWTDKVTFDDIGHWGGSHPLHIKSEAHAAYSAEVGRPVNWSVEAGK